MQIGIEYGPKWVKLLTSRQQNICANAVHYEQSSTAKHDDWTAACLSTVEALTMLLDKIEESGIDIVAICAEKPNQDR